MGRPAAIVPPPASRVASRHACAFSPVTRDSLRASSAVATAVTPAAAVTPAGNRLGDPDATTAAQAARVHQEAYSGRTEPGCRSSKIAAEVP